MYAQYQQYQNQINQYQTQHAYTASPSQAAGGDAQWNGTSWTRPSNTTQQQQQQQQSPNNSTQVIPPNPVETYTQYYHDWTKRQKELEQYVRDLQFRNGDSNNNDNELQNAKSNCQWAKYYAEESSRAAHYFHQNPHATSASFNLPPAPHTVKSIQSSNVNSNSKRNSARSYATYASVTATNKKQSSSSSTGPDSSSGSITRYVKRNMERSQVQNDPKLKKFVTLEIEKDIAAALQKGTFQSKNWDLVPLIPLPSDTNNPNPLKATSKQAPPPPPPPPQKYNRYQQQKASYNGCSLYHENKASVPSTNSKNHYGNSSSSNDNYYGPVHVTLSSASSTSPKEFSGKSTDSNGSHYGPASSHNNAPIHDFQQMNSKKNNINSSSSSHPLGKKENGKRPRNNYQPQDQEEVDFIPFGSYGPSSSNFHVTSGKKPKKKHRKNHHRPSMTWTASGTMRDKGMDHSQQTMAKRANRFKGPGGIHDMSSASNSLVSNNDRYMGKGTIGGNKETLDETDFEQMTVKGTSTTLEKEYLRLTAPPRAERVRPFGILKKHLRNLQHEYYCYRTTSTENPSDNPKKKAILQERMQTPLEKRKTNDGDDDCQRRRDYLWFCSQLKAIRQDCTVQRIRGYLAVDVYETHARIALQEGDLNEYNQCQTQLKELYKTRPTIENEESVRVRSDRTSSDVLNDKNDHSSVSDWKHQQEFIAYRLLYYVFLSTNEQYSGGSSDMFHIMLSLTAQERDHPAIRHALKVREAVAASDYFRFFRLHRSSPNLGVFLTNLLVPIMRFRGLRRITKAYRPSIELSVCLQQLGFRDEKGCGTMVNENPDTGCTIDEDGKAWLTSCGCVIDGSKFVTKDSQIHEPTTTDKKNSLI